jgi:uncharacterized protein (DUF885 family)
MKHRKYALLLMTAAALLLAAGCGKETTNQPVSGTPTVAATQAPTETVAPTATSTPTPTPAPSTSELFDAYTEQLFLNEIALNTINLHYTLAYPETFGITEYEPSLGSFDMEEMKQSYGEMKVLKEELEAFAYEELTKDQQFTYDIIMDYIETELSVEDLLLYSEVLGPVTGYQAQLPVLLAEYKFRTVRDIEDYLALVGLVDELFAELVEFEQAKSAAGLFMPDYAAEAIIDQCRQFIETPEDNYMIDVFETEINAVEGLTEDQKQTYIAKNKELITTELVTAYQSLIDGLEALKGTGTNEKGLYYFEDGKRYYEYLVRSLTGSSKSVTDLMIATDQHIYACIMQMQRIMMKNPNVLNDWDTYEFCESEPEKILEDLIQKIKDDFPELPVEANYVIKYVHPSMEEHMSPAFYLTPPVDDTKNNTIYINNAQVSRDLYTTMAHEGFPGHLYQNVYTSSKNLPLVRNLFSNQGYSEGWATYVEYYAYGIGGLNEDLASVLMLNNAAVLGIYAYVDMGVHYLGWGVEEVEQYLTYYGLNAEAAQPMFEIMVEEPANYLSYFIGYLEILNLQDAAETAWGANYSLKKFHEAVLSLGPAPFALLEEAIKVYE